MTHVKTQDDEESAGIDIQARTLSALGAFEPLTHDALVPLTLAAQEGERARHQLILSNTDLISWVIDMHAQSGLRASLHAAVRTIERTAYALPSMPHHHRLRTLLSECIAIVVRNPDLDVPSDRSSDLDVILLAALNGLTAVEAATTPDAVDEEAILVAKDTTKTAPPQNLPPATDLLRAALTTAQERFPLLSPKRERELALAYRTGKDAFDKVWLHNSRLVISIAKRYRSVSMSLADRIMEGEIGLKNAILRFDPDRGFKFSTYASWWIRHAVSRALADKARTIRIPVHASEQMPALFRAEPETMNPISNETLSELSQIPVAKVRLLRPHMQGMGSLDRLVTDKGGNRTTYGDMVSDDGPDQEEGAILSEDISLLTDMLRDLPQIEQDILRGRFFHEQTLREIGLKYNLSRERIRQLQEQALRRLRDSFRTIDR